MILSTSLTSCTALQGYGDDLEGRTNEVSLDDVFLYTRSPETPQLLTIRNIYYFYLRTREMPVQAADFQLIRAGQRWRITHTASSDSDALNLKLKHLVPATAYITSL